MNLPRAARFAVEGFFVARGYSTGRPLSFIADIRHWPTPAALAAHLARHVPPGWAEGVTIHHTVSPLPSKWAGRASVEATMRFYIDVRKWDRGPHLFLCLGSPNPANDGIWQLTPLNVASIHAGRCNTTHWGIEVVGNYDHAPWSHALADLVYETTLALLRWAKLPPDAVNGHRECLNNKTCPGRSISMPAVRAEVARRFKAPPLPLPPIIPPLITPDAPILSAPRCSLEQARRWFAQRPVGEYRNARGDAVASDILPRYWDVCRVAGVDPCLAVAQMAHETASLNAALAQRRDRHGNNLRNPAGIGVNSTFRSDVPGPGLVWDADRGFYRKAVGFPSWDVAVQAHVGRLVAYATKRGTPEQEALVEIALAARPLAWRGRVTTIGGLGGTWAENAGTYGPKIVRIMNEMRSL